MHFGSVHMETAGVDPDAYASHTEAGLTDHAGRVQRHIRVRFDVTLRARDVDIGDSGERESRNIAPAEESSRVDGGQRGSATHPRARGVEQRGTRELDAAGRRPECGIDGHGIAPRAELERPVHAGGAAEHS